MNVARAVIKNIIVVALLEMIFLAVVVVQRFLPVDLLRGNIARSYSVIDKEITSCDIYVNPVGGNLLAIYDDYTIPLVMDILYCSEKCDSIGQAFEDAISNKWQEVPVSESGIRHIYDGLGQAIVHGPAPNKRYSHYWLGFNFIFALLFQIFSITEIRYLLYLIGMFLICANIALFFKHSMSDLGISYIMAIILFGIPQDIGDFEATPDILLLHVMVYVILKYYSSYNPDNLKRRWNLCFLIGALQAYLGFVYAQMMVLGTLLVLFMILDDLYYENNKRNIIKAIGMWLLGYGITLGFRQLLAISFADNYMGMVKLQRWSDDNIFNKITAFTVPLGYIFKSDVMKLVFQIAVSIVVLGIIHKRVKLQKKFLIFGVSLIFISFLPAYVWFFILSKGTEHWYYLQNYFPMFWMFAYLGLSLLKGRECVD